MSPIKNGMKQMAKRKLDEAVGRSFIFSMLQGVVDRKMIRFPDGITIKVNRPTGYIIRSFADGWITDERYGSFDEMMTRCNENITEGRRHYHDAASPPRTPG